jgi:AbrB family looped-hinge helix DNA binding protein
MGDRGRLVVPVELRNRLGLQAGTPVLLVETDAGIIVTTREHAKRLVRAQLQGVSLVAELLAERRSEAAAAHGDGDAG